MRYSKLSDIVDMHDIELTDEVDICCNRDTMLELLSQSIHEYPIWFLDIGDKSEYDGPYMFSIVGEKGVCVEHARDKDGYLVPAVDILYIEEEFMVEYKKAYPNVILAIIEHEEKVVDDTPIITNGECGECTNNVLSIRFENSYLTYQADEKSLERIAAYYIEANLFG